MDLLWTWMVPTPKKKRQESKFFMLKCWKRKKRESLKKKCWDLTIELLFRSSALNSLFFSFFLPSPNETKRKETSFFWERQRKWRPKKDENRINASHQYPSSGNDAGGDEEWRTPSFISHADKTPPTQRPRLYSPPPPFQLNGILVLLPRWRMDISYIDGLNY